MDSITVFTIIGALVSLAAFIFIMKHHREAMQYDADRKAQKKVGWK